MTTEQKSRLNMPKKYQVKTSIIINTPSSAVWDVLKDFGNVSDWAPTVTKSHYLSSQTSGVGTGRYCHIQGFGSIEESVTEWKEGKGFVYTVTPLGPLDTSQSSWWITEIDENVSKLEVTLDYDVRFSIFGRILHKLVMRKKLEQALPETLVFTKEHVEKHYKKMTDAPKLAVAS